MQQRFRKSVSLFLLYTFAIDAVAFGQVRPSAPSPAVIATQVRQPRRTAVLSRAGQPPKRASAADAGKPPALRLPRANNAQIVNAPTPNAATPASSSSCAEALQNGLAPKIAVAKSELWPPNHALVDVGFSLDVTSACAGQVSVRLEAFADEPDEDQTGDGNQPHDAQITPPEVYLRSERKGNSDGRVYLLIATATGPGGVSGVGCAVSGVPQSRSKKDLDSITSQKQAALAHCEANDAAPSSFYKLAEGELLHANQAPVVSAGPDQAVDFPATAALDGTATDDGLPSGVLTLSWSKVDGPGTVTFSSPNAEDTTASFSQAGTYTLRISADDTQLSASDTVTVVVAAANTAPVVDAGVDQTLTLPTSTASLSGQASDDGRPNGTLITSWSVVNAPSGGQVTFADPSLPVTTAAFSAVGEYVLKLTANDGQFEASDTTRVTVSAEPPPVLGIDDLTLPETNEGTQAARLPLTLSKAWPRPVSVDYMTFDGTATVGCDYKLRYGTVSFAPGETQAEVVVPVIGEVVPETNETVVVRFGNASEATLARSEAQLVIQNDDASNDAPFPAASPAPADGAIGVGLPPTLSWTAADPDAGDAVTSDLHLGTAFDTTGQTWARSCPRPANRPPAPRPPPPTTRRTTE